jgi:hypothetical protein
VTHTGSAKPASANDRASTRLKRAYALANTQRGSRARSKACARCATSSAIASMMPA